MAEKRNWFFNRFLIFNNFNLLNKLIIFFINVKKPYAIKKYE
mgnify:CR=1 FL=1